MFAYLETPEIAFECAEYLVVFKPRLMHTDGKESGTLYRWLTEKFPSLTAISEDGGLIQRLDFYTAGLLVAAKTPASYLALKEMLKSGQIKKTYLALVEGAFSNAVDFTSFIGSPYRRAKKVRVYESKPGPGSKHRALEGTTYITPLLSSQVAMEKSVSVIRAAAPLARRHQIRAHCAHLGHPLVGDETYGSARGLSEIEETITEGFFLFASELTIPQSRLIPATSVSAAIPVWLTKLIAQ